LKRFKFRLERLLQIFYKRRDQQKIQLSKVQRELNKKELEIEEFRVFINGKEQRYSTLMKSGGILPMDCVAWENYIDFQYISLKKHVQERKKIQVRLENAKRQYIAIDKEVKTLEKLKDKKQFRFNTEMSREEQKEMDEIAIQRIVKAEKTNEGV